MSKKPSPSSGKRRCESCNAVLRSGNITKHCSPCTYRINAETIRSGGSIPKRNT
jgi:hypothetical protein